MTEIRLPAGTQVFAAPVPVCPEHGAMKPRAGSVNGYTATVWACPGWDGEGCSYEAPPREWGVIGVTAGPMRMRLTPLTLHGLLTNCYV